MIEKMSTFATHHRWTVIILFVIITIFFAFQLKDIKVDPTIESMMPDDYPAKLRMDKIEEIFGGTEFTLITFQSKDILAEKTLKRLKTITRALERTKGIEDVISLTNFKDIRAEDGSMVVESMIKRIPRDENKREDLRTKIKNNEMIFGELVSEDFTATAIIAILQEDVIDDVIIKQIRQILEKFPGDEETHIGGMPATRAIMSDLMIRDVSFFIPAGLLIMLIFLFVCFREIRGVFLPFSVVIMSIIVGTGFIVLFHWKFQIITMLLPVFLIAVANDYGIHIIANYQEENLKLKLGKKQILKNVIHSLTTPVMATGITTIFGLLCLQSHIILPAKQVGILSSIGVVFALFGSLLFIPAVLSLLPRSKYIRSDQSTHFLEKILKKMINLVNKYPKRILLYTSILIIICLIGCFQINVDTNLVKFFKKNSEVYQTNEIIKKYFGGVSGISIVAKGDIKNPEIMKKIDWLVEKMEKREMLGNISSISKVIRKMNKVMHDDLDEFDRIPDTREMIAQYFLLYNMSGDPEDFEKMVDFNFENALISARISSSSNDVLKKEFNYINNLVNSLEDSPFTIVGGYVEMELEVSSAIVKGQIISLFLSLFMIGGIVALFFRSVVAGLLSAAPLAMAISILFGLMGFFKIELNVATAILSAIMIGVGVDYTIHFLWRYRDEIKKGKSYEEAISITLITTGRGIIFNALSVVIGFLVLFLSGFRPLQYFGFLITVSISACLIGALLILPSICVIVKPKFLEK